jgi:uncharacterized protein YdeI (YjbR/CyaY-like superfamily)
MDTAPKISSGTLHRMPDDLKAALLSSSDAMDTWEDITSVARDEWICWVESAKKAETRMKRIASGVENLSAGKRRPCCWPGCPHRNPKTEKWFSSKKQT